MFSAFKRQSPSTADTGNAGSFYSPFPAAKYDKSNVFHIGSKLVYVLSFPERFFPFVEPHTYANYVI